MRSLPPSPRIWSAPLVPVIVSALSVPVISVQPPVFRHSVVSAPFFEQSSSSASAGAVAATATRAGNTAR